MKKIIYTLIALTLISLVISYWRKSSGKKIQMIKTESPYYSSVVKKVVATGKILPRKEVEVKSQMSGIVEEIYVGTGELVKKGSPLAKIKIIPNPESINSAESSLRIAQINLEESLKELNRQKDLFESGIIPEVEFNQFKKNHSLRMEEFKLAENTLELIKEGTSSKSEKKSNVISATMDGTVLGFNVEVGSPVMGRSTFSEGTTILILADMNNMVFQGKIGEADVGKLQIGMDLELIIGAIEDHKVMAKLEFISPKGETASKDESVEFWINGRVLPNHNVVIRAGYSANADIILNRKDSVLVINEKHLIFQNDSTFVELKNKEGLFEKRHVNTGISDGLKIEIISGLKLSDEIKVKGNSETMKVEFSRR